tara:strand:+ start:1783 stop:3237 length:1455 start_codon:yes stop_codon:yes gene_type:complete
MLGINLGKFGEGFVEGFATSVDKALKEDMADTKRKKEKYTDLGLEKTLTEKTRFDQESAANLKAIQEMTAQLDTDVDTIRYIYNDAGSLAATQARVAQLVTARDNSNSGFDPIAALRLEEKTGGKTTAIQMANFMTSPMTSYDFSKLPDLRTGLMKYFGDEESAKEGVQAEIAADAAILGAGKTSLLDIPPLIKGRGVFEWQLMDMSNTQGATKKLASVMQNLRMDYEDSVGPQKAAIEEELVAARTQLDLLNASNNFVPRKPFTEQQIENYDNTLSGMIATQQGLAKIGDWTTVTNSQNLTQTTYNTGSLSGAAKREVDRANAIAISELNKGARAGMTPAQMRKIMTLATSSNQMFKFYPASTDGITDAYFELVPDTMYVNTNLTVSKAGGGQVKVFPGVSATQSTVVQTQTNAAANASASTGASTASVTAKSQLNDVVQAIQTAFAAGQNYQVDLRKLEKMINPQTGQPYGLKAAKKLAGVK